jgi:ABC-type branched-subunit amino acid transport system substrate-binding protein
VADVPGGATEGIYTMTATLYVDPNDPRPAAHAFATKYEKLYGHSPNFAAEIGYSTAELVVMAFRKAGRISPPKASLPRWRVSKITTISSALRQ